MKAVGRIQIPGTLGYDLSFIRLIDTPTGRTIRFVTNRKIQFAEAYYDTQSPLPLPPPSPPPDRDATRISEKGRGGRVSLCPKTI